MSGAFSPDFSRDFDAGVSGVLFELDFRLGVDDHPRPRQPLWERYRFVPTQLGLLLYRDGRVVQVQSFETQDFLHADDYAAGGAKAIFTADSWQYEVLLAAGYTFTEILPPVVPRPLSTAYGEGIYGAGKYGGRP